MISLGNNSDTVFIHCTNHNFTEMLVNKIHFSCYKTFIVTRVHIKVKHMVYFITIVHFFSKKMSLNRIYIIIFFSAFYI